MRTTLRTLLLRLSQAAGVVGLTVGVAAAASGAWNTAALGLASTAWAVVTTLTTRRDATTRPHETRERSL